MRLFVLVLAVLALGAIFSCGDDDCPTCPEPKPDLRTELTSGWWSPVGFHTYFLFRADSDTLSWMVRFPDQELDCLLLSYELVEPDTVRIGSCWPLPDCSPIQESIAEVAYLPTGEPRLLMHATARTGDETEYTVFVKEDPPDSLLTHCGFD